MKDIGEFFGLHYSSVSRIINNCEKADWYADSTIPGIRPFIVPIRFQTGKLVDLAVVYSFDIAAQQFPGMKVP